MAIFIKKLGIDLGTTNTRVYVPEKGIVLNEPSVVAVSKENGQILAIGNKAKETNPNLLVRYITSKDFVDEIINSIKIFCYFICFISKSCFIFFCMVLY